MRKAVGISTMDNGGIGLAGQIGLPVALALLPIVCFIGVAVLIWFCIAMVRKAGSSERETVAAIKENSALMRELIVLNRQILERRDRS
jgi:threonine/homoserine/homoserine lactone efflux protein